MTNLELEARLERLERASLPGRPHCNALQLAWQWPKCVAFHMLRKSLRRIRA